MGSVCPFCAIFPKPGGRSRLFAPKTTASSRFKLHSAPRLRLFMILNRFPQNNREKLVVPRRRYVHILGHIAEANVTFRGKGGTAEHVTDFVFKIGTKRSLFRRRRGDPQWSPVYCPHTMRTIRDLSLCGRSPLHIAQFIRLSLIIRIDGGRCVKKRGKNIFFYIADMSRVFAHAVKNIENMPVMKL